MSGTLVQIVSKQSNVKMSQFTELFRDAFLRLLQVLGHQTSFHR